MRNRLSLVHHRETAAPCKIRLETSGGAAQRHSEWASFAAVLSLSLIPREVRHIMHTEHSSLIRDEYFQPEITESCAHSDTSWVPMRTVDSARRTWKISLICANCIYPAYHRKIARYRPLLYLFIA